MPFSVFNAAGAALNQSLTDTPVGSIQPFAGASAPSGWLLCDGAAVSRTDYAELFAVLGTTYGTGNGSTTFNVPDLRGRVPAGLDNMGGNAASRLTNTVLSASNTLGATGGAQTHTLSESQIPSHRHEQLQATSSSGGNLVVGVAASGSGTSGNGNTGYTGGGDAHTNTQPTLVVNYIILASSLATRLQAAALPQYVTSLPSSPVDGQTVVYAADASNGVMWTLRYRAASSSSYKWEFVGGGSLTTYDGSSVSASLSANTWSNISTAQEITVPIAGDYIAEGSTETYRAGSAQTTYMGFAAGSTEPTVDTNTAYTNAAADTWGCLVQVRRLNGLSATNKVTLRFRSSGAATIYRYNTSLCVTPVRVG